MVRALLTKACVDCKACALPGAACAHRRAHKTSAQKQMPRRREADRGICSKPGRRGVPAHLVGSAAAAEQGGARDVLAAQAEAGEFLVALGREAVVAGRERDALAQAVGQAGEEPQEAAGAAISAAGGERQGEAS